ncbi:MAG: putative porin [Flavobacteriaceae bacterium]|nr:putative porin [Flavobacteriaceae bacterium]
MQKSVFVLLCLLTTYFSFAQLIPVQGRGSRGGTPSQFRDSVSNRNETSVILSGKTTYKDYKVISYKNDTTYVDTTASQLKYHKFNYIRKDDFELLPFHNQGQTFNSLGYNYGTASLYPEMGARAKHFNYYETQDINYYRVATPTTELMYRTGLEQGQVLDAIFTANTSKQLNFSIAYKGLRSLGKYRTALSSHGNLRITSNYHTKNDAYNLRAHVVAQDLTNDENGGLTDESVINFETNDSNFTDRARLTTNFNDGQNLLRGNRYYLEHDYKIWQRKDTLNAIKTHLRVGNILNYERKHYDYRQANAFSGFGEAFNTTINDTSENSTFRAQAYIALKSPIVLGELKFKTDYYDFQHGYNSVVVIDNITIPSSLNGNTVAIGGEWKTRLKKFNIDADVSTILSGDLTGNYIKASASYAQDSLFTFKGTFLNNNRAPNFNFLLNQSSYVAYNWKKDFRNEITRSLIFELKSEKLLNASAQITQLDNYTYFSDTTATQTQPSPLQTDETINYLKIRVSKDLRIGKFGFDNTLMYQKVANGSSVFRVPEFVTRNSIYFADHLFKGDPLYLQTGVTLNYFTKYFANAYSPVLSEFHLQNEQEIGGYPVLDFFINAQIQRTRIYFKLEHFNSNLGSTNDHYAAPLYPYRDFVVRFGLVWNFFI